MKLLEEVTVTLTKYAKHGNVPVQKTNIRPFATVTIDNAPSTPPDFFYGIEVSGVTAVTHYIETLIKENAEMKEKIIKLSK